MKDIKLTIGVNIYNVEEYLRDCLDSVVSQIGNDLEIILVDDGSTDNSGKICEEYAAKDSRIRVIHQHNVGLGLARNVIIDNAKGDWITFVDGDDSLTTDAVEKMRPYFLAEEQVVIFLEKNMCKDYNLQQLEETVIAEKDRLIGEFHNVLPPFRLTNSWGKLLRTSFIRENRLRFRDLRKSQDLIFTTEYLFCLDAVRFAPHITYIYRDNPLSVSNAYNPKVFAIMDKVMTTLQEIFEEHHIFEDEKRARMFYKEGFQEISYTLRLVPYHKDCYWNRKKRLEFLKEMLGKTWVHKCIRHEECLKPNLKLEVFCKSGKTDDLENIDKFYLKYKYYERNKKFLKKVKQMPVLSSIYNFLKTKI